MVLFVSGTAAAATPKTIAGVTIRVGININAGDMLPDAVVVYTNSSDVQEDVAYVGTNSDKYWIRDTEWITTGNRYASIGDQPKMRIYLTPNGDYAFRGSYSSSSVTVKGGTFLSARKESDGDLSIVVSIPIKGRYPAPTSAGWYNYGLGRAVWNTELDIYDDYISASLSGYYDICLYRGNSVVHKVENYHGTTYNFYPYMTRQGTYYYKVRSVPHTQAQKQYGTQSEWTVSDEIYIGPEDVSDGSGRQQEAVGGISDGVTGVVGTSQVGWIQSNGSWYFRYPNGTYQSNGWLQLNGVWYLFDSNGRMLTGWQQSKGLWYYLQANGAMYSGWLKAGNYWYYLNTPADGGVEGAMRTGWLTIGGKTYYLNADGIMLEGWQEIDKKYYYFYPGYGYKATNTMIGTYFYVDANGVWNP